MRQIFIFIISILLLLSLASVSIFASVEVNSSTALVNLTPLRLTSFNVFAAEEDLFIDYPSANDFLPYMNNIPYDINLRFGEGNYDLVDSRLDGLEKINVDFFSSNVGFSINGDVFNATQQRYSFNHIGPSEMVRYKYSMRADYALSRGSDTLDHTRYIFRLSPNDQTSSISGSLTMRYTVTLPTVNYTESGDRVVSQLTSIGVVNKTVSFYGSAGDVVIRPFEDLFDQAFWVNYSTTGNFLITNISFTFDFSTEDSYHFDIFTPLSITDGLRYLFGYPLASVVVHENVYVNPFIGWLDQLTLALNNFFEVQIFGAVRLGELLWFCVGLGVFFFVLKFFFGG